MFAICFISCSSPTLRSALIHCKQVRVKTVNILELEFGVLYLYSIFNNFIENFAVTLTTCVYWNPFTHKTNTDSIVTITIHMHLTSS